MIKNFLKFAALAVMVLAMASCKQNKDSKTPEEKELTFEDVLKADYDHLYQQGTGEKFFYEIECELNGKLSELAPEDVKIVSAKSIGVVDDVVYYGYTDFETGETVYDSEPGRWAGSFNIPDISVVEVSFKEAVEILKGQGVILVPDTQKMTFRHPVGTAPNPMYIFGTGSGSSYVAVDAVSGAIGRMKSSYTNGSYCQ